MNSTQINRQDLGNDALHVKASKSVVRKARASLFSMEGQVVVHTAAESDFGSNWNRWMDRIGAERGSAEDLRDL